MTVAERVFWSFGSVWPKQLVEAAITSGMSKWGCTLGMEMPYNPNQ